MFLALAGSHGRFSRRLAQVDALLDAFATVAGGRDYITVEDLHAALPPEEAKFLLSRMDGLDLGLDYKTFANKVFGIMRNS